MKSAPRLPWYLLSALLVAACSSVERPSSPASATPSSYPERDGAPLRPLSGDVIADAVPRHEVITASGNTSPYVVFGKQYELMTNYRGYRERGVASWYGTKFHGRLTSNGEVYDLYKMTAAHKTLPIPVYVRVTNLENGRSAVVRVNDRGPFHGDRLIDLSYAAAVKLGFADKGTARVEIELIEPDNKFAKGSQPASQSRYFLQVGAFQAQDAAIQLQAELSARHELPVHISLSEGSPSYHRVRVGPFTDYLEAERVRRTLQSKNYGLASIVTESSRP